jgi:N-acetylgalactosamine-6-sulfatase
MAAPPNIILILADDLGYGDLGCQGHPQARTPNLDRLAAESTRFTQFYVTGVTCCPSRTGFMTGKFPATFANYPAGHGFGARVTVTELLKKAGYATGHFGKWHIGRDQRPGTYGIDTIGLEDEETGGARKKTRTATRSRDADVVDDAIQFIERQKGAPFYVNVWGHISHFPVNPPAHYADRFRDVVVKETDFSPMMREKFAQVRQLGGDVNVAMRKYLGDLSALDDEVGRLLRRIDELGLRDKTLIVFSSDHGPAPVMTRKNADEPVGAEGRGTRSEFAVNMLGSPGPFRGGKHGMYDGGVRVPFLLCWPGHTPAGRVDSASVISGIDWLPTLCAIAGIKIDAADFDGEDVSRSWRGDASHVRVKPLLWKVSNPRADVGVRSGDWKLILPIARRGEPELYQLSEDPGETRNVAAEKPDVVKRLSGIATAWNATLPKEYDKAGARED